MAPSVEPEPVPASRGDGTPPFRSNLRRRTAHRDAAAPTTPKAPANPRRPGRPRRSRNRRIGARRRLRWPLFLACAASFAATGSTREVHVAWDYDAADVHRLTGFEIRTAEMRGDLMTRRATATLIPADDADDAVTLVDGLAVGFEGSVTLPPGFSWLTARAYIVYEGNRTIYGPEADPILLLVTPTGTLQIRER